MIDGAVAHLGERIPCTDEVASSILVSSTKKNLTFGSVSWYNNTIMKKEQMRVSYKGNT